MISIVSIEIFAKIMFAHENFRFWGVPYLFCVIIMINCTRQMRISEIALNFNKGLSTRQAGRGHATPHTVDP